MPALRILNRLFFVSIIALSIAACSKSADEPAVSHSDSALLKYIPADSPYVFASLVPLPVDVLDLMEPRFDTMLRAYAQVIRAVMNSKLDEAADESQTDVEALKGIGDELVSLMSIEGIRGAGIGQDSTMIFYGDGLLPVLRIHLTDGDLMEQTITRIEKNTGSKMSVSTIDGQAYRHAGDEKAQIIVAIIEDDLVISAIPEGGSDILLKSVLGLTKPDNSMADSTELQTIAASNGFSSHYLLLLDFTRMASVFVDDPFGTNKELLSLMSYDASVLSDVCKSEIREMAEIAPRMIAGYTDISTEEFNSKFIIELRQDIASGLMSLVAPVQGLGTVTGGLFSFGMSMDMSAAREFYSARLDALEADPYECEQFADIQAGVAKGRQMLDQPLPPMADSVKGFFAVVDAIEGLDIATKQPPTSIDASFLLSIDNPQGLLAMGSMFSPELAALNLKADGKPARIELPPVSPALSNAYIAMTDTAMAISLGDDAEDRLGELLDAKFADPAPFLSMDMDAGKYYSFIGEAMSMAQTSDSKTPPELNAAMTELMGAMENWFGRMSVDINFTKRGIEMPSEVEISDAE